MYMETKAVVRREFWGLQLKNWMIGRATRMKEEMMFTQRVSMQSVWNGSMLSLTFL